VETSDHRRVLSVALGESRYGLEAARVLEVASAAVVTAVPGAPAFVAGVASHRGKVVPVVDLAARLGLPPGTATAGQIVHVRGPGGACALMVDRVLEMLEVAPGDVSPAPALLGATDARLHEGIVRAGEHLVALLDLDEALAFEVREDLLGTLDEAAAGAGERAARARARGELHLVVEVEDALFCIAAAAVAEVGGGQSLEPREDLPDFVPGLVDRRGRVYPAISLRRALGLQGEDAGRLLVHCADSEAPCALAVDRLVALVEVSPDELKEPPELFSGGAGGSIQKLVVRPEDERVMAVLEPGRLLEGYEISPEPGEREAEMDQDAARPDEADELELFVFRAGEHLLALRAEHVREVVRKPPVSWVPFAPPHVAGVFHLRGEVVPLLNLLKRLGDPEPDREPATRVLVMKVGDHRLGLLVHELVAIRRVPAASISSPPAAVRGIDGGLLEGIAPAGEDGSVLVLDPSRIQDGEPPAAAAGE